MGRKADASLTQTTGLWVRCPPWPHRAHWRKYHPKWVGRPDPFPCLAQCSKRPCFNHMSPSSKSVGIPVPIPPISSKISRISGNDPAGSHCGGKDAFCCSVKPKCQSSCPAYFMKEGNPRVFGVLLRVDEKIAL